MVFCHCVFCTVYVRQDSSLATTQERSNSSRQWGVNFVKWALTEACTAHAQLRKGKILCILRRKCEACLPVGSEVILGWPWPSVCSAVSHLDLFLILDSNVTLLQSRKLFNKTGGRKKCDSIFWGFIVKGVWVPTIHLIFKTVIH